MADILISKFTTQIPRVGATPATPGFAESEGQDPVAPSGTPQVYTPVTIGSPANGLSISGTQVLTIGLASTSATGALSSADWNTFNNKLNLTSPITGYTVGANTALAATDTILQAFGKVQGQINARISGTIASGQVAFGTGVNTVGGDAGITWDNVNKRLSLNGSTQASTLGIIGSVIIQSRTDAFQNGFIQIRHNATNLLDAGAVIESNKNGTVNVRIDLASDFISFSTAAINSARVERWQIISSGILQSVGAQQIRTSTGNLTLATAGGNGNIFLTPNGTGLVMIGSGTPTNLLDVNGTARIRTISNLGSAATSVLVPSATGVVSLRTLAEFGSDLGALSFSGTQSVAVTGTQIDNLSRTENFILFTGTTATNITGITGGVERAIIRIRCEVVNGVSFLANNVGSSSGNRFSFNMNFRSGDEVLLVYRNNTWEVVNNGIFVRRDVAETIQTTMSFVGSAGGANLIRIFNGVTQNGRWLASGQLEATFGIFSNVVTHLRSNGNTASVRRDELYLNYSETVATAGTINDLAINASTKLLILTGATDLTGVVPVDNGRLLRIEARSGNRIIRHESASSTADNRFSIGADLTINAGEVYQFIYTDSRWRRVL